MCGIAGIVTKTKSSFDYATFCTLGIANDARGGDSCGIFIDGKYEYGVKETKLFSSFFPDNDLLNSVKQSSIAFVHCRKASVGAIDEKRAQPVIIKKGDKIEYVLMHNGTIYNYQELAKKYIPEVDIVGMTDSQVMANIFYRKGYACLNEYQGGAVFAIADYRFKKPKVFLFKGASKNNTYSKEKTEERPLFYCIDEEKEELVFSSICTHMFALRRHLTVYYVPENMLLEFDGTDLEVKGVYIRDNVYQTKINSYYTNIEDFEYYGGYDSYVTIDKNLNLYSCRGKKLHGKIYMSNYGRVEDRPGNRIHEIYFYDGILLKNIHCFRFLSVLQNRSGLSTKEFKDKYEILIRFLSLDQLYCSNNVWRKAITPIGSTVYTGVYHPITSSTTMYIIEGHVDRTDYKNSETLDVIFSRKFNIDFKEIRDLWKLLTK